MLLHPIARRGVATIATLSPKWIEKAYPIVDLPRVAAAMRGLPDVYVSQQSFWHWRKIIDLAALGACYSDLDYKNTSWAGETPERVADAVLRHLDNSNLPAPTYILSTGRGLCVVWLHDHVASDTLPKWMAVQKELQRALASFGSDPRALDAARLFRLCGSRHSRADAEVRAIWAVAPLGALWRWDFNDLCIEIMPTITAEPAAEESPPDRGGELIWLPPSRVQRRPCGDGPAPAMLLTARTLHHAYLSDLQKVRELRWWGGLPPHHRDLWLFLAANSVSWFTPAKAALQREIHGLARQAAGWTEGETDHRLGPVVKRAEAAAREHGVSWNGKIVDARYRFRAATIIEWLEISQPEMRAADLRVLIDPEIRREHATERQAAHRRRLGAIERSAYEAEAAQRAATATVLRAEGLSWVVVGARMGISAVAARLLVSRAQKDGSPPRPAYTVTELNGPLSRPALAAA